LIQFNLNNEMQTFTAG